MLLSDLVATSGAVGATRSRTAKVTALADLLSRLTPDEIEVAVGFLTGEPRQGRIGVGWATLGSIEIAPGGDAVVDAGRGRRSRRRRSRRWRARVRPRRGGRC